MLTQFTSKSIIALLLALLRFKTVVLKFQFNLKLNCCQVQGRLVILSPMTKCCEINLNAKFVYRWSDVFSIFKLKV